MIRLYGESLIEERRVAVPFLWRKFLQSPELSTEECRLSNSIDQNELKPSWFSCFDNSRHELPANVFIALLLAGVPP